MGERYRKGHHWTYTVRDDKHESLWKLKQLLDQEGVPMATFMRESSLLVYRLQKKYGDDFERILQQARTDERLSRMDRKLTEIAGILESGFEIKPVANKEEESSDGEGWDFGGLLDGL